MLLHRRGHDPRDRFSGNAAGRGLHLGGELAAPRVGRSHTRRVPAPRVQPSHGVFAVPAVAGRPRPRRARHQQFRVVAPAHRRHKRPRRSGRVQQQRDVPRGPRVRDIRHAVGLVLLVPGGQVHGGRLVRRAGRPPVTRRPGRGFRPGRRRALQQRDTARFRRQVPRAVRAVQQLSHAAVDQVAGRTAAADRVQALRVQRPVGAHGPRPAAGQRGVGVRGCRPVPDAAPALEPARAERASGRRRVLGRVRLQRQPGAGQHALDHQRGIAHRAGRAGSRRDTR